MPIENHVSNNKKRKIRKLYKDLSNDHLAYLFSNVKSLNIKIIILSLLPFNDYYNFKEDSIDYSYEKGIVNKIREYCKEYSIKFIHLPYFAQNLQNEKIDIHLNNNDKRNISVIIQESLL